MPLRATSLTTSFLWPDLGWLHLRLCQAPGQPTWTVFANANSGPWTGDWVLRSGPDRTPLAVWMATLPPDEARALLCAHPPFAQALHREGLPHSPQDSPTPA